VLGIVPFNAPVNLACHKIAPALAAGNSIIIKAPPQAPATSNKLALLFLEAGVPPEALSVIHGGADIGDLLVSDERVDFISFTGSHSAGLHIKKKAGTRGCILELGGLGPVIVHKDADIAKAAKMCTAAGFRLAGQSCASVQNLFVHDDVYGSFQSRFLTEVGKLKSGDPADPDVDLGPVIDDRAAVRIEQTVKNAGATVLAGGGRQGRMIEPTVIADATPDMDIIKNEIFGPVVVLRRYDDLADPIDWVCGTRQGINCGLFTASHEIALRAVNEITCAAVIVNGTCTFRPEQFPYGGDGASGYGRESPRDTVKAMTKERILVF
jgi:acyl-CoA reductase-like NAD-dependent aldehyde dehydrogenase